MLAVIRRGVGDAVVLPGIAGPEHDLVCVFQDRQVARLGAFGVDLAHDVGHDARQRALGIIACGEDGAARQVHQLLQHGLRVVGAARALPSVGAGIDRPGTFVLLETLDFLGDEVQGLIPRHAHEIAGTAAVAFCIRTLLEIGATDHRILDAARVVDDVLHAVDRLVRERILVPGTQANETAVLDLAVKGAPVRRRENLLGIICRKGARHAARQHRARCTECGKRG